MSSPYGSDVSCTLDIDPYFTIVEGPEAVAQALVRRLVTPAGGLIDDPDGTYGYDLREMVNRSLNQAERLELDARIEAQCLLDERVDSVDVDTTIEAESLTVGLNVTLVQGETFSLTLTASALTFDAVYST